VGGERREPAQVAEHHDHFDALAVEHAVIAGSIDQFRHLRREKALEPVDTLRMLLRDRQLARHLIEPGGQPPKFVPRRNLDAIVELARADALGTLL
jgi:hypothetical protein